MDQIWIKYGSNMDQILTNIVKDINEKNAGSNMEARSDNHGCLCENTGRPVAEK